MQLLTAEEEAKVTTKDSSDFKKEEKDEQLQVPRKKYGPGLELWKKMVERAVVNFKL